MSGEELNEKTDYWAELAEYDLETARVMLAGGRLLYVGFMCHQVVEKALKAYYVNAKGGMPPYVHNLRRLASESGMYAKMSEEQKDLLDVLEPLNIEARYPTQKESLAQTLSQEFCEGLLKRTEELYLWIRERLSSV